MADTPAKRSVLYVETFDTRSLGFYWRLKARNREILATSEGYNTRAGRDRIAARVAKASGFELVRRAAK